MSNVRMLNVGAIVAHNKCSHHTVDKPPSLVNFGWLGRCPPSTAFRDGGKDNEDGWVLKLKLVYILLHAVHQLHTPDVPHVVAATMDDEDIWHLSSSHGVTEEGQKSSPSQSTPAKPAHPHTWKV